MSGEYLQWTLTCLIYLFIQALLINGVFISAKGKSETLPDGSVVDSEMILYPLYKFLNQSTVIKMPFTLAEIKKRTNVWPMVGVIWSEDTTYFKLMPDANGFVNIQAIETWAVAYLNAKIFYDPNELTVLIYQDHEVFKFSKYLRKPVITCIICMASFWSVFTFLIPAIIIFGFGLKILLIWVGNVFCLSYLNYLIFKPRK